MRDESACHVHAVKHHASRMATVIRDTQNTECRQQTDSGIQESLDAKSRRATMHMHRGHRACQDYTAAVVFVAPATIVSSCGGTAGLRASRAATPALLPRVRCNGVTVVCASTGGPAPAHWVTLGASSPPTTCACGDGIFLRHLRQQVVARTHATASLTHAAASRTGDGTCSHATRSNNA